jgi:hypothetical protein
MVTQSPYAVVRWTHLPTGTTAQVDGFLGKRPGNNLKWAHVMARKHLLAKLCRPAETPAIRRSYYLNPCLGIEPFVIQDGVRLAVGMDEINAMLDGKIPEPKE